MPYTEISDGPKGILSKTPIGRMQGGDFHSPRGVSPEQIAGVEDLYRKLISPEVQRLFRLGLDLLLKEARSGGKPEMLAGQLSQLFGVFAKKAPRLTDVEFENALEALQKAISDESKKASELVN